MVGMFVTMSWHRSREDLAMACQDGELAIRFFPGEEETSNRRSTRDLDLVSRKGFEDIWLLSSS
jgi:hypothetical protein